MWLFSSLISLLADNLIFSKALGTSTLMAASKNRSNLVLLSLTMTGFSVLGCLLTSVLYFCVPQLASAQLVPAGLLRPLVYIALISVIYLIVLLCMYGVSGRYFTILKKYIHLSAFNCAVMGTLYLGFTPDSSLQNIAVFPGMSLYSQGILTIAGAVLFGLHMGLGFVLASLMLLAVRKRLYDGEVPEAFRGFPAVLVYIGLLSMAIYAITA